MGTPKSNQIGYRTAGNANILSILGDLVSSDGIEALRVPLGTPGDVLTVDLTAECGFSWQPGGGGGGGITNVTGSDGITVTTPSAGVRNVANRLVTGQPVDQVNIEVPNTNSDSIFQMNADGSIVLAAGDQGGGLETIIINGGVVNVVAEGTGNFSADDLNLNGTLGNATLTNTAGSRVRVKGTGGIELVATGGGQDIALDANDTIDLHTAGGQITIHASGEAIGIISDIDSVNLTSGLTTNITSGTAMNLIATAGDMDLTTSGAFDINFTSGLGMIGTAVGLIQFVAGGSGEFTSADANAVNSLNSNVVIAAGGTGGTGEVQLQPGTISATRTFKIWDGAGGPQQPFAEATGGTVVDVEARAAINAISNALQLWGWFAAAT